MKKLKNHIFKVVSAILIVLLGIYVCTFAIHKARNYEIYKEKEISTKIYTIWHIETFEGGGKARIQFLKNIARELEKKHDGVLFMVKQIEADELETSFSSSCPDMISFGFGVGKLVLPYLTEMQNSYNVRDDLVNSAKFGKKLMALPYISSGYALFSHGSENNEICYGHTGFTNPENLFNEVSVLPVEIDNQYQAYKKFIYNKNTALIGTARDVFRINNLNNIGRTNASITPLSSYTDLIQYFGICKNDNICEEFLSCVLNDYNQTKLVDYSLFSVKYNKLYSSGIYNDMENAIFSAKVPNVFDE